MGNNNTKSIPNFKYTSNGDGKFENEFVDLEFSKRWEVFIQSLDVGPENVRQINRLEQEQKEELLLNFEAKNTRRSSLYYVNLIRGLRAGRPKAKNVFNKSDGNPVHVLSATEVSLRTNNVEWVYDFLNNNGLEILIDYMSRTLVFFLNINFKNSKMSTAVKLSEKKPKEASLLLLQSGVDYQPPHKGRFIRRSSLLFKRLRSGSSAKQCTKNSLHQGLKCMRAILNNQRGCEMAFEHCRAIEVITLCLLHPSYQTKTLVLEILTAVCLIVNGLQKVLSAFDYFREVTGEHKRFEKLVMYFREHDSFNVDNYNIDFMVACMQFINIIVHSGEDINLRVYLQQEFALLGLDDFYKKLHEKSGDRLKRQVEAYSGNHVDVALLLEETEAKDALSLEVDRLEHDLFDVEDKYQNRVVLLENRITELLQDVDVIKAEKDARENEYNTLRIQLSDPHAVSSWESTLQSRIESLETILRNKQIPFDPFTATLNVTAPTISSVTTPPAQPPPPPSAPPPPAAPPPIAGGPPVPPPPPGSLVLGNSSQAMPIRPPIQSKFKLPMFNWTVLKNQQLKGTVFVQMNDEQLYDRLEFDQFEDVFKLNSTTSTNGLDSTESFADRNNKKRPEKKSLIDPNRHRCVGVLQKFLVQEKLNSDSLNKAINDLDIGIEIADRILYQLPTTDDVKMYRKYEFTDRLPVDALSDEDRLLLRLCKIERLPQKLEVVLYIHNFQDSFIALSDKVKVVTRASLVVRNSQKLRQILEIVLAYGNYMNSSRRGIMYGFRLQSLDLLSETKNTDKSWTLMQFYVSVIEKKFPELIGFIEEMRFLEQASKVPMEAITTDVQSLVTGMKQVRDEMLANTTQPIKLRQFFDTHEQSTKDLLEKSQNAKETFLQAAEWFGERQNNPTPDQFFGILCRFTDNFKKALEDNAKRRQANHASLMIEETPKAKPKDKKIAQEARKKNRRILNRTRQINGDGIMDEILAGLGNEPLQAEVHTKRSNRMQEEVF